MAKRAESYNQDRGNYDANYVSFLQPTYWDNLHQALLAAAPLASHFERMQSSFVDNRVFDVPESLFETDCPSHYMLRIEVRRLELYLRGQDTPASIHNCTLTLTKSSIRLKLRQHAMPQFDPAAIYFTSNGGIALRSPVYQPTTACMKPRCITSSSCSRLSTLLAFERESGYQTAGQNTLKSLIRRDLP